MWLAGLLVGFCSFAWVVVADHTGTELSHYHDLHPESSESVREDATLKVPELVRKYGYPLEVHEVTTDDGYTLTMHRIPHGKDNQDNPDTDRPVVFIMHGLLSSSADWVIMGPGKGLGYILAEEGFDVWLGNARGNRYSRRHRSFDPDTNSKFWQFSWDEIGNIDVPTMIDFALSETGNEKLHYIGHSQGTTSFFVMCSMRPEYNHKIISMNALAPVAYMAHSGTGLLRVLAPFTGILSRLLRFIGMGEFLPNNQIMRDAAEQLCADGAPTQNICSVALFLIGWNSEQFNKTMIPVQLGHAPAGASVQQFAHYAQNMNGNEFRRYHYGCLTNLYVYGSLRAPSYDLSNIKAPVYLHYATADSLAHFKDVYKLQFEIGKATQAIMVPLKSFNHLDFIWGIDAKTLVYDKVIEIMKSYDST